MSPVRDRPLVGVDRLPEARGALSASVLDQLCGGATAPVPGDVSIGLENDDAQLALWLFNVVRVADFDRVHRAEVDGATSPLEAALTERFAQELRGLVPIDASAAPTDLAAFLDELRARPSVESRGAPARDDVLAAFAAKAPYLGWEADPHTLLLAVVEPELKQPLATIQAGEYGVGHGQPHARIYRECLAAVGLTVIDAVDGASGPDLALANSAWLFARHRRLRGASLGQLCFLEVDSVEPCRERASAWDEVGLPAEGRRWYDVHVLADAEHQDIVRHELVPRIEERTPWLVADVAFGAEVTWLLQSWPRRSGSGPA